MSDLADILQPGLEAVRIREHLAYIAKLVIEENKPERISERGGLGWTLSTDDQVLLASAYLMYRRNMEYGV